MKHYHVNSKEFVVGATVGSLLGSAAALLMAPKSGKKVRQGICDVCSNFSGTAGRRGKYFAKKFGYGQNDWSDKARSLMDGASKCVNCLKGWCSHEEEEECNKDLLIGGLVGGLLGAVAGLLLAPKSGEDLRHDIADTYEDISERTHDFTDGMTKRGKAFAKTARSKANKWADFAQDFVDEFRESSDESTEDLIEKAKGLFRDHRVHNVLDWASLGFRLWQGIKARR